MQTPHRVSGSSHEARAIFRGNEEITLSDRALSFMVSELAKYDFGRTDVDAKGAAYQEIVGTNLRGDRGQYFTPRGAIKLMVQMLDPKANERVLDPACGTGGFLVATLDHLDKRFHTEAKVPVVGWRGVVGVNGQTWTLVLPDEPASFEYSLPYTLVMSVVPEVRVSSRVSVFGGIGGGVGRVREIKDSPTSSTYDDQAFRGVVMFSGGVRIQSSAGTDVFLQYDHLRSSAFGYDTFTAAGDRIEHVRDTPQGAQRFVRRRRPVLTVRRRMTPGGPTGRSRRCDGWAAAAPSVRSRAVRRMASRGVPPRGVRVKRFCTLISTLPGCLPPVWSEPVSAPARSAPELSRSRQDGPARRPRARRLFPRVSGCLVSLSCEAHGQRGAASARARSTTR